MSSNNSTPSTSKQKINNFKARLTSTILLLSIVAFSFYSANAHLIFSITLFLGILTAFELQLLLFSGVQETKYKKLYLISFLSYYSIWIYQWITHHQLPPLQLDLFFLTAVCQLSFFIALSSEPKGNLSLKPILLLPFAALYGIFQYSCLIRILLNNLNSNGLYLGLFLVLCTKFTDLGAYVTGSLFGKHKMIPHISPGKTWQGLAGGILFSLATGYLCWFLMPPLALAPITLPHLWWIILLISGLSVVGDLAESIIKRNVLIKDSGSKLPGIGGILDLTDSLLFTAPWFYLILSLL
jgi:phosphatidate cytidylyltransferase